MTVGSKYWRLVRLGANGNTKIEEIILAKNFLEKHFSQFNPQTEVTDNQIQHQLFKLLKNYLPAQICLRCFISHQIEKVCIQLELQFGKEHGFDRHQLFPFVLDDTFDDLRNKGSRKGNQSTYKSVSIKILNSFNPEKANLSTWTTKLVKQNRELNVFLLEHGIYLISNWAILNDTTSKQVQRILTEFHNLTSTEIEQACFLLESYHAIYRQDRLKQRLKSRGKCPTPSSEQLQRIAECLQQKTKLILSEENTLSKLQELAELLREYRIHVRSGKLLAQKSLDNTQINTEGLQASVVQSESEQQSEQSEFTQFYRQQFIACLNDSLEFVIQNRFNILNRKSSVKAKQFLTALQLFHCQGKSITEIAPLVNLKAQYQVTRLLKLKEFRADIRQKMLEQLCDRTLAKAIDYASAHQLQQLEKKVAIALEEQIGELIQAAEVEASIANTSSPTSFFAEYLCRYLDIHSTE